MPTAPGRTDITSRALTRTVEAIAADELGVPYGSVSVTLRDDAGLLGISISAPVPLPEEVGGDTGIVSRGQDARAGIRESVSVAVDRTVGRLSLRLTKAIIADKRRVS